VSFQDDKKAPKLHNKTKHESSEQIEIKEKLGQDVNKMNYRIECRPNGKKEQPKTCANLAS
jgi:hypothetical protein